MIAQTTAGKGVQIEGPTKRARHLLDAHALKLMRARTFEALRSAMTIPQIADCLNFAESTVEAALAWIKVERREGRDVLPWDHPRDDADPLDG